MSNDHIDPIFAGIVDAFVATQTTAVKPVQVFDCPTCGGDGFVEDANLNCRRCIRCAGRGMIATEGGEP